MSSDEKAGSQRAVKRPRLPAGPLADLKALIYEAYLRAGPPTLDEIVGAIASDDDLAGAPSRDTVSRLIGDAEKLGTQAEVTALVTVLARLALWDPDHTVRRARDLWLAAAMDSGRAPQGGVLVSEADPRRLGVHAAISVPGAPDDHPPEYVPRDADEGGSGLRARVATAARAGGFVLLVGGSSVGKSRCAYEAVTALLPGWWLVHPVGPGEVAALAADPPQRTVVWLDELQRYMDGEHGLAGGTVRSLLDAPGPVVIIATLWPEWHSAWTALPGLGGDPYARERQVMDLADVVRIAPEFSPAEQGRARDAAGRDLRVKAALGTAGYGLTQTLAGAPQLVARWEDARTAAPYGRAVLAAALDAARLGARAPLSAGFLRSAAPGYCTSAQQAEAPENWFELAMAYATQKLRGAVAPLSPQGAGMGQVTGYTVAGYLVQHAARERARCPLPASTWDAAVAHLHDPGDATRLANSALARELNRYALPLYQSGDDHGGVFAGWILRKRGDLDEAEHVLRAGADAGDRFAAGQLADLLRERGDLEQLQARADAGDGYAARELAGLLRDWGDLDKAEQVLRARADAGDGHAAKELAELLRDRGDVDGAEQVLRAADDAGDESAGLQLAMLLSEQGNLDGLRARADAGDDMAIWHLARLLRNRGDQDHAEQFLRPRAEAGSTAAAWHLAILLRERGDLGGLRARAEAGDGHAARHLAELLRDRGDLDGAEQVLRARAAASDIHAAHAGRQLARLLQDRGDLDGAEDVLRARADAGDTHAAVRQLDGLLRERGDLERLRARADAGDIHAAPQLAALLQDRGDPAGAEEVLRASASVGDPGAATQLATLLGDQGRHEEAERLTRFGLTPEGATAYL